MTIVRGIAVAVTGGALVLGACSSERSYIGFEDLGDGGTQFTREDASSVDCDADPASCNARPFTQYCPSDKCPANLTTCPTSRFACDVDLKTDGANCGACGAACPAKTNRESYQCVDGTCVLVCSSSLKTLDCDGIVDDGCETDPSNDNCGACGKKCLDPEKPCVKQSANNYNCGCISGQLYCTAPRPGCYTVLEDDRHCGTCDIACDRTGGGRPSYPNSYYGCAGGECGHLKCRPLVGNCDGVLTNGCETSLVTDTDCGGCGHACPAGQRCVLDANSPVPAPTCMCPPGKTFCDAGCDGELCVGWCTDLATDRYSCGACGASCEDFEECIYGACTLRCEKGSADCDGNRSNGCETNINSDPRNCGGCGIACDGIAGQACVLGRCVVEPCDSDAGVVTR